MARQDQKFKRLVNQYMNTGNPIDSANFGAQASNLYGQYKDTMGLLKYQRGTLQRQGQDQRQSIRQQRTQDMSSAAGAALERGVLGSSSDVDARLEVQENAASALAGSRAETEMGLSQNVAGGMAARRDYQSGILALLQQRTAAKAMGGTNAYLQGVLDWLAGNGQGGPGPGKNRGKGDNNDGRNKNPSGGGSNSNPSGPFGLGPLQNANRGDIRDLKTGQQRKLVDIITNKMQKRHQKLEGKGFDIFNDPDSNRVLKQGVRYNSSVVPYLTKLNKRRQYIKKLLAKGGGGRATGPQR